MMRAAPTPGIWTVPAANWWGSHLRCFEAAQVVPVRTGNAQRTSMVRITEVDAHGHEIETKEEPKTR